MKIYGDVLAAVNFTVTLLILQLSGRILGIRPGRAVKYISGALGAAAAFIIFVPIHSVAVQLLYRLAVSVLLVGVAFPALNRKRLLRAIGVFYLVSIVFAGVTMLLIWLQPGLGFYTANGVVYYNIPPLMLLACVATAYGAVSLFDRFTALRMPQRDLYRITIERRGRMVPVMALADSGLGSAAALYLTGAGVGRIGLADADTVSKSNLQRQVLYTERQIGMPKSAAARERLAALSSHTAFECRPEGITPENARPILDGYDLILDCCDNFPTRYLLDDLCAACRKPWVHGSIGEFYGQVTVFNGRKGRRYRDLYPDRKALCARPRITQGVLGTVPGVIGTLQASEAIKYLCGFGEPLDGRLFTIDLRTLQTQIIDY